MDLVQLKLFWFASWLLFWAVILGPAVGLSWLRDLRDRRRAQLLGMVTQQMAPTCGRCPVGFAVRCALFSRKAVVTINMNACSRDEIWEATRRLSHRLPPWARLVVLGTLDGQPRAAFQLEARRPFHPSHPAPATSA